MSKPTIAFGPPVGDVKDDGTLQFRVREEMDDVVKTVTLQLNAGDHPESKCFALRVKSGPGCKGLILSGVTTKGDLPHACQLTVTCGEVVLDEMARRRGLADTPKISKKKRKKRLQKAYEVVFEAVGLPAAPTGSMKSFWRRVEAGEFGATAEHTLVINVKEKKKETVVEVDPSVTEAAAKDGPPDYVGISFLLGALLFAVYIFLQPIPEEILPPCNATLNITDHCINASEVNGTLINETITEPVVEETYDGENDEDDEEYYTADDEGDDDDVEDDDDDEDYSTGEERHGELRRRV